MQREGIFREMRQHGSYEKPSERRNREKSEAIRRARKLARKKAQREGLIPMSKAKPRVPSRGFRFPGSTGVLPSSSSSSSTDR
jgi:small subunit ribosomal protein S21